VVATDAAALGSFKKQAHGHATNDKKKNLLCFGCDFSGWYNFRKVAKILPPNVIF